MLKTSKAIFNELDHSYVLNGKQLSGVSKLYNKHILKRDKFVNERMMNAADYGSSVHKEIENYINQGIEGTLPEFWAFKNWYNNTAFLCLLNWADEDIQVYGEFLIDNATNATSIDILIVNHEQKEAMTVNAKCTTKQYPTEWAYQSSFEKAIFEKQTGYKVVKMLALQLQGNNYDSVELKPIDEEKINAILECEKEYTIYNAGELVLANDELDLMNDYAFYLEYEQRAKAFKELILQKMLDNKLKRAKVGQFNFTVTEPTVRQSLDSKALEKEHPDIYAKFIKTSNVSESLRIKILDKEG